MEAQVLSPLHIAESGEPSFKVKLDDGTVNGWDFFALAPAEAALRPDKKLYALPSRSLKGLLRHIYTIASNSATPSTDLSKLNPADALFGWVGQDPNQAIMGRLAFDFGLFENAELTWFKVPYPYTGWTFEDGKWQHQPSHAVPICRVGNWRLFRHAPLAPMVKRLDTFVPDTARVTCVRSCPVPARVLRFVFGT